MKSNLFFLFFLLWSLNAFADGNSNDSVWYKKEVPAVEVSPNTASDASFDKRLPPVLPGETVNDSGGKKKVWSTSGPVPVSKAPEPFNAPEIQDNASLHPKDVSVVVDQRDDRRTRRKKK